MKNFTLNEIRSLNESIKEILNEADTSIDNENIEAHISEKAKDAEAIINEPDKFDKVIKQFEDELKTLPALGKEASTLASLIGMVRAYMNGYTEVPVATIVAIVGGILLALSIPGPVDDVFIVKYILDRARKDVDKYISWRENKDTK